MNICVFSDIHGNQYALKAFMNLLPNFEIDHFIFCGDIFGYYYGQQEVIDTLSRLKNLTWVMGNHDKNILDAVNNPTIIDSLAEKYGNTYKLALSPAKNGKFDCLKNLKPKVEMTVLGKRILAVHGTIDDPQNGRLYPKDADKLMAPEKYDICIMGHTHFRLHEWRSTTLYLNPGSLGQPRDKQKSCFAILSLPKCTVRFVDVTYDKSTLEVEIRARDIGNEKLLELLHRSS